MWEHLLHNAGIVSYVAILLAVAVYGFHRYMLVYLYLKHRNNVYTPKGRFQQLPHVTVQLPMYNEDVVAERIIKATCHIDYPLDRLEIQVLDDSTDHSAEIAKLACDEWAAKGFPIRYIHRTNRVGYKAGALEAGLADAKGEYIAIFDADFVPPKDILRKLGELGLMGIVIPEEYGGAGLTYRHYVAILEELGAVEGGIALSVAADRKYDGPRPPKPDVPYLVHADNLLETETVLARSEERGNQITYSIPNPSSPVRTPLAEPIFLVDAQKLDAGKLELYRFEVKSGRRQLVLSKKPGRNDARPLRLKVTQVEGKLYRVEANEGLENGEYALTPDGSDQVFAFQVY